MGEDMQVDNCLINDLIEAVEDWLEAKRIKVPNKERDKQDPTSSKSAIWGDDYGQLMADFKEVFDWHGIEVSDTWESDKKEERK